jgi:hypothetical protein
MSKGKLTITVQKDNIRWAKKYVKQNHISIGNLMDELIESLKAADAQGRIHPWVKNMPE